MPKYGSIYRDTSHHQDDGLDFWARFWNPNLNRLICHDCILGLRMPVYLNLYKRYEDVHHVYMRPRSLKFNVNEWLEDDRVSFFEAGRFSGFSAFNFSGKDTKTCRAHPLSKKIGTVHPEIMLERQNRHCELPGNSQFFFPCQLVTRPILFLPNTPGIFLLAFWWWSYWTNSPFPGLTTNIINRVNWKSQYFCNSQYTSHQYKQHAKRCLTKAMAGYLNKNRGRARKNAILSYILRLVYPNL